MTVLCVSFVVLYLTKPAHLRVLCRTTPARCASYAVLCPPVSSTMPYYARPLRVLCGTMPYYARPLARTMPYYARLLRLLCCTLPACSADDAGLRPHVARPMPYYSHKFPPAGPHLPVHSHNIERIIPNPAYARQCIASPNTPLTLHYVVISSS